MTARPVRGTSEHRDFMVAQILEASEGLNIPPSYLARDTFLSWAQGVEDGPTRTDIDVYGTWAALRAYAVDVLGTDVTPLASKEEMGGKRAIAEANRHRRSLERELGQVEYIYERLASTLEEAVRKSPPVLQTVTKKTREAKPSERKAIVAHLSDLHFGLEIDPEEVLGQRYSWPIAARRMGRFCEAVIDYVNENPEYADLHIVMNGDIIEGKIHNDDSGVDLLTRQVDGARQLLTSVIDCLRQHFDEVFVECTSGNHGRWPFKGPGRATAQKYDGATTLIYRGMEMIFRDADDVSFNIPKSPFAVFDVCGHLMFATHGDTVLVLGNPGKSINVKEIVRQVLALETSGILSRRPEVVMLGHHHFPTWFRVPSGPTNNHIMVNGCASGLSAYANSIGIFSSTPVQTFFGVSKERAVESFHMVDLDVADEEARFEGYVPVPTPLGAPMLPRSATTDFFAMAQAIDSLKKDG